MDYDLRRRVEEISRQTAAKTTLDYLRRENLSNLFFSLLTQSRFEASVTEILRQQTPRMVEKEVKNTMKPLIEEAVTGVFLQYISRRSELEEMVNVHRSQTKERLESLREEINVSVSSLEQKVKREVDLALSSSEARAQAAAENFSRSFLRENDDNPIVRAIERKSALQLEKLKRENEREFKHVKRLLEEEKEKRRLSTVLLIGINIISIGCFAFSSLSR